MESGRRDANHPVSAIVQVNLPSDEKRKEKANLRDAQAISLRIACGPVHAAVTQSPISPRRGRPGRNTSSGCSSNGRTPASLIVDELGFVTLSKTGVEVLFEVFSQRYERSSTLVTSNLPFAEWTEVLGSERLTGA